jgi:catechol 2,3-dioxygenase-like lactoylglutathione lyase family enzyme
MKIILTSVLVDDQANAERFYTETLGFVKKHDVPLGENSRWLTVVGRNEPDGTELLLEPDGHPAAKQFKEAMMEDGIPMAQFGVDDIEAEYKRLSEAGVRFTMPPTDVGPVIVAWVMETFGASAFFTYTSVVHAALVAITLWRMAVRSGPHRSPAKRFVALLRTSPAIFKLARRGGEGEPRPGA